MSDLALAAFAAETGSHLVAAPRTERYARFRREFDETAYRARLAERALRFIGRSAAEFPVLLRAIHDPPAGLFLRGGASLQILGAPRGRGGGSPGLLDLWLARSAGARS